MIITKFNSYLEKHSKKTYFVLCIIIAIIFVFTIGSGDSGCTGEDRLTSIGSMYGSNLAVADVMRKGEELKLLATLQNRPIPSSTDTFALIQMTLEKMRLVHHAKELKLDDVSDEDMATFVAELPYWRIADKDRTGNELDSAETTFTTQRFKAFIENVVKGRHRLSGADFDQMVKDEILASRVIEKTTAAVVADEKTVRTLAAVSTLKTASYPFNLEGDSRPAPAAIDDFLKNRGNELTEQDRMTNYFLIAYHTPDRIADEADRQDALKDVRVPEADVKAAFDKQAATTYKDKKFEDVKDAIARELRLAKAQPWLQKAIADFAADAAKPIKAPATVYARFRADAQKRGLHIATQNGIPESDFVAGIEYPQKALANAIRALKDLDKPTAVIALEGDADSKAPAGFAVAVKVNNPNAANNMRNAAANILRGEAALKRFDEKIAKAYTPMLANVKGIEDFIAAQTRADKPEEFTSPASFVQPTTAMENVTSLAYTFFKEENGAVTIPVPDKRDAKLLNWYKREVAAEAALKRATDALAALQDALKAGKTLEQADAQKKFVDVKQPVSWLTAVNSTMQMLYQQMMYAQGRVTPAMMRNIQFWGLNLAASQMGVPVKNFPELVVTLDQAADNTLLDKPVAGNNGYFLVYQVSRALPTGDHAKDVDDARSMVLNDLKAKAVNALKAELLAASDTRLADEIMPVQDAK